LTGKVINGLVHINRIKPYFYRDELPDDLEDVLDGNKARLDEAQVPGEVAQEEAAAPKVVKTKTMKKPKSHLKSVTDMAPIEESTQSEQIGVDKLAEIDEDTEVPDPIYRHSVY